MDVDSASTDNVLPGKRVADEQPARDNTTAPGNPGTLTQSLTSEQQALLARRLIQKKKSARGDQPVAAAIAPVPRDQPLPLSFSQQRAWFLDQFEPGTPDYNIITTVRLVGDLHVPALHQTLDEIVRRHEALRTVFVVQDGQPRQVIQSPAGNTLITIDLEALPAGERSTRIAQIIRAETRHNFDLAAGPLFRATLMRLDARVHMLCVNVHHIVFDGWSGSILLRELEALYHAFRAGLPSPLPELPVQYADYACWQQQLLQGAFLDRQLAYWQQQLRTAHEPLNLPTDRPRPAIRTSAGARLAYTIDRGLTGKLKQLAGSLGVSLYIVLLAALKSFLYRYTSATHIGVGTFIANRHRKEIEPLIGFFVNTLVLHTDLAGQPTFRELMLRVRQVAIGAYEHQDLPFEKLLEKLAPERDMSRTPFFQVMLVLQNTPQGEAKLADLEIEVIEPLDEVHSHCDFSVWLAEENEQLVGWLEYNTDLFDRPTIARWSEQLTTLLAQVVANPDQPIATISLLPSRQQEQILKGWSATSADDLPAPTIPALFEQWVAQTPDAVAVRWQDALLTYAELDRRANQLARALQARGVGPDTRVGLCLQRSPALITSILAVLKAGGCYVPLDPAYPRERLLFMLRDSQPRLIVTEQAVQPKLPSSDLACLCLDTHQAELESYATTAPACRASDQNLAYSIYTSGSTGASKGVLIERRSLHNYTAWANQHFGFSAADRVLQFASISFDAAAEEIYPTLTSGGTLVLRDEQLLDSFDHLLATCDRHGITVLDLPTAYWHQLTAALAEQNGCLPPSVRLVIIGGERALPDVVARWHAQIDPGGRARLVNTYGPTEATIVATCCELTPERVAASAEVPIGRPVGNLAIYVLDRYAQPVPVGVPGELYIGGAGLARGYQQAAALTAQRFVPHPWSATPGQRLYRTGDLVRWLADGTLEFCGRNDDQVKIRGFRIEPGEIEALLRSHPAVQSAVVMAREDQPAAAGYPSQRLVAYLVPKLPADHGSQGAEQAAITAGWQPPYDDVPFRRTPLMYSQDEPRTVTPKPWHADANHPLYAKLKHELVPQVRAALAEQLPEYMLPSAFVILDALPMTLSGKIDRQALPPPDPTLRPLEASYVAPRDAIEMQLAEIWEDLLGVAPIGAEDSFFNLGGHSLLAVHLMARIQRRFNKQLPLTVLFQGATIERLAGVLRSNLADSRWSPLVPMQTKGSKPPLFCLPGAGGNVIGFYSLARSLGQDRPIYGLQARGVDGEAPPHTSVEEMAAFQVQAIRSVQPEGPYYLCGHSFGCWVAFEIAQQLQRQGQQIGLLALFNTPTPRVLSDDPAYHPELRLTERDDLTLLLIAARSIERTFDTDLKVSRERLLPLAPQERITYLAERLKQANILPPEADTRQLRGYVDVFKTNYAITYLPADYIPTPIVLFRARARFAEDTDVPLIIRDDPAWGWNEFASEPVAVHFVPGEHQTMMNPPHVQILAERLRGYLR